MLQSMRHLAQSWLFKGLMLILVISFGIWGIGDIFHGNTLQRTVAKTGGVTISIQQLNHEFEDTLVRARQMFGPDLTAQQARQIGLLDTALNTLIQRAEIDQQIKHLGIVPDDRAVLDELLQQPQMRNKDGSLNRALFQQALTQSHVSEQDFFASERQSLARRQLLDALMMTVPVPQTLIDTVAKARGQKRIFDLVILKNNSIKDLPQPDDAMLQDFYKQNAKDFTAPEYRAVTIAKLSTEDVAKEITIGDDQLHKEYDAKGDQLAHPELRNLLQVVLQDEDKARKLAATAKASGNLAATAKVEGVEAVPLDGTDAHSLMPELAKPAFALRPIRYPSRSRPISAGMSCR